MVFLETRSAQDRTTLGRPERNGRFFAARRAIGARFRADPRPTRGALRLALLAPFGIVFEIFIVEE